MRKAIIINLLALAAIGAAWGSETITFPSKDGLIVTADVYRAYPDTVPLIILFHQAGSGRGEYLEIAPRLNKLGFNAMAVDLRSGSGGNGLSNETAAKARAARKSTVYQAALPDMEAAIAYAKAHLARGKIILWGSSYSASLVLKIAGDNVKACDAVLAFSPGEYFGQSAFIQTSAKNITVPVFVSSAREEGEDWRAIFEAIPARGKRSFLPKAAGLHGSSALWPSAPANAEYWAAVEPFLNELR